MPKTLQSANLATWCAYAAFVVAAPTMLWRFGLAAGFTLGTPQMWRDLQDIPGAGTVYVLSLSVLQLVAMVCMLALAVEPTKLTPRWFPPRLARLVPAVVGGVGLLGTAALVMIVTMSIIAWDKVNPYEGVVYDAWAWMGVTCYFLAALWPLFLGVASVAYLIRYRPRVR